MKYHVTITEINYGGVDVEAATEKEAQEKARQEYYKGNVFWKDSELSDLNAEPAPRREQHNRKRYDRGDSR